MAVIDDQTKYELDALFLKNQPVAKDGALIYPSGGGRKLRRDLERNAGRTVVIVDGHPSRNNGKEGLHNGEKTWGKAHLKMCPLDRNKLCADLELDDDAPDRDGYSIGFSFDKILQQGEVNGVKFNHVQANLLVNHVALTDYPRDDEALQLAPRVLGDDVAAMVKMAEDDGRAAEDDKQAGQDDQKATSIIKRHFAVDSYRFTNPRVEQIKHDLREDPRNNDVSEDELHSRAVKMYVNEAKLKRKQKLKYNNNSDENTSSENNMSIKDETETEKPKVEQSGGTRGDSIDAELKKLRLENAQLKADKNADEKYADELKKKQDHIEALEKTNKRFAEVIRDSREKGLDSRYKSIADSVGLLEKDRVDFDAILTDFVDSITEGDSIDEGHLKDIMLRTMEWYTGIVTVDPPQEGKELDDKQKKDLDAMRGLSGSPLGGNSNENAALVPNGAAIGQKWSWAKGGKYIPENEYDPREEARYNQEQRRRR